MARVSTKKFLADAGRRSGRKFSNWRDDGETTGWIHPRIGIHERDRHGAIPSEETNRDGETEIRKRFYNCAGGGCPLDGLGDFAGQAIDGGADPDEVLLQGGDIRLTLNQVAGREEGKHAWRTRVYARREYLIPWIPAEGRADDNPVEIITAGDALHYAISRVIERRIKEKGDERGDPMVTPYAMTLTYKEKEAPMRKYDAFHVDDETAPIDEDVKEIMDAEDEDFGINMDNLTAPGDPDQMMDSIASCWVSRVVSFDEFAEFMGLKKRTIKRTETRDEPEEKPATTGKVCGVCDTPIKRRYCPECAWDSKGEEKPARKTGKAKVMKQETECPGCGEKVTPTRFGRCPECRERVDVPI
jgi:hypothetical protein